MDIISSNEFNDICNNVNTKIIKFGKVDQPKVYEAYGKTIIKLFYPKKSLWSSDRIKPRAIRFCKNVRTLHSYGYTVPQINKFQFCPDLNMYVVHYDKIQGNDVRALAKNGNINIINQVAKLIADLHKNGIFFRSIHLENLLYKPDGSFALLDLTDVKFKSRSLNLYMRYRNIKHLLQEPMDRELWEAFGIGEFLKVYYGFAGMSGYSRKALSYFISRNVEINFPSTNT